MGRFKEFLQTQVKKSLEVEGDYFADTADDLQTFGNEIFIAVDEALGKNLAENVLDPLKITLNANRNDNISNYSKFLNRINDETMEDPEATKRLVVDIQNTYGDGIKTKTLKVEDIVKNATPDKIRSSLDSAFNYQTLGQMTNEHFVLNLMNGVNISNEFRSLAQQLQKATDKKTKQQTLKNLVVHLSMLSKVSGALNQDIRSSAQKLAAIRHGKKITEVDFDSTLKEIVRLDLTNMDEARMDQLGRILVRFNNRELVKVAEQVTPTVMQKILQGGKGLYDVVMELYYNSLLSAFPTHVINSVGSTVHIAKNKVDDFVASGIGTLRVKAGQALGMEVDKFDRVTLQQAKINDLADISAQKDAMKLFIKTMITGEGTDSVTKFDFKRKPAIKLPGTEGTNNMIDVLDQLRNGQTKEAMVNILGIASRISGTALNAEDTYFKFFAKRRFLYQEAYKQSDILIDELIQQGKTLAEAKEQGANLVNRYMSNPTREFSESVLNEADEFARTITFQQELGPVGKRVTQFFRTPGLAFLAPFVKTPLNISKTVLDNTFNIFNVITPLTKGQGREFDKALAKILTGNAIMQSAIHLTSGMYGDNIKVTGGPHPDYKVRKFMREMNIPTYSIGFKQDDGSYKYIPFSRVDPISGILAMAADYNQYRFIMGADELESLASIMTMSVADYVSEQPFLQGFAEFNKIFLGEYNSKAFGTGLAEWFGGKSVEVIGTTLSGSNPLGLPIGNTILKYMDQYDIPVVAPASSFYRSIERSESPEREDPTFDTTLIDRSRMHTFFKAFQDKRRQMFAANPQFNDRYQKQKGMFYKDIGASEHILFGYEKVFSPFYIKTSKPDDVEQELLNLAFSRSGSKSLALVWNVDKIGTLELNDEMKNRFNQLWSQMDSRGRMPNEPGYEKDKNGNPTNDLKSAMRKVIKSPTYKTLSDDRKFEFIQRVYQDRRNNAVDRMTKSPFEFPELYNLYEKTKNIKNKKEVYDQLEIMFGNN